MIVEQTPSQQIPTHSLSGSVPASMKSQAPFTPPTVFAPLQDSHRPLHARSQQKPSTQWLLAHSPFPPQVEPFARSVHAPAPLQVEAPLHSLAGSCPLGMFVQVPTLPVRLHALQRPAHVALQQTPSMQFDERHSLFAPQVDPVTFLQAPFPLHTSVPAHSLSGSWFEGMFVQVPTDPARSHAAQVPAHAALQQTPSVH